MCYLDSSILVSSDFEEMSGDEKLEADLRSPWLAGVLALLALLWLSLALRNTPLISSKLKVPGKSREDQSQDA